MEEPLAVIVDLLNEMIMSISTGLVLVVPQFDCHAEKRRSEYASVLYSRSGER